MRKKLLTIGLIAAVTFGVYAPAHKVKADSATVVTVGADLTETQRNTMFDYFGVTEDSVAVLEVTNDDEREYLEGVATEAQLGKRTYSCAYIEPTEEGNGIHVKLANLTWVNSYMIASTLGTAGIYDCNVVAAAPFAVSGTGALTGIMKAFEIVTGTELDEDKKEAASEELIMTGDLADEIGTDEATGIITDVKNTVIGENIVIAEEIQQVVIDSSTKYEVTLTDEQVEKITETMVKIAALDYDYDRLQSTFESITESTAEKLGIELTQEQAEGFFAKLKEFFAGISNWFKNLFGGTSTEVAEDESTDTDLGILGNTNDELLGEDAVIDATDDSVITQSVTQEEETEATEETEEITEEDTSSEIQGEDETDSEDLSGTEEVTTDEVTTEESADTADVMTQGQSEDGSEGTVSESSGDSQEDQAE